MLTLRSAPLKKCDVPAKLPRTKVPPWETSLLGVKVCLAGGQLSLHGGGAESCQHGLRLGEFVDLGVVQQATSLQQPHDALGGRFDDLLDVRVL